MLTMWLRRLALAGVLGCLVCSVPKARAQTRQQGGMHDQEAFAGTLGPHLRAMDSELTPALFRQVPPHYAVAHGVKVQHGDRCFRGEFRLPKNGPLRYGALLIRHADGESTLYIDSNRNHHFEAREGVSFRPSRQRAGLGRVARFRVELPPGPFSALEMQAWLAGSGAGRSIMLQYTAATCVAGRVQVPGRVLGMCFDYNPATERISLAHTGPPVFRVGGTRLRAATVDLATRAFVVVSLPEARERRVSQTR